MAQQSRQLHLNFNNVSKSFKKGSRRRVKVRGGGLYHLGSKSVRKDTNPKDNIGIAKVPFSTVPAQVIGEVGLALFEGARKYRRHNWRVAGVRASVYYDACFRHLTAWWEGEDIDTDSGLNHVSKAIASLVVLRDSMNIGNWNDDRPPKLKDGWVKGLNEKARGIIEKYPKGLPPYEQKREAQE